MLCYGQHCQLAVLAPRLYTSQPSAEVDQLTVKQYELRFPRLDTDRLEDAPDSPFGQRELWSDRIEVDPPDDTALDSAARTGIPSKYTKPIDLVGTWPGDEPIEELLEALRSDIQ